MLRCLGVFPAPEFSPVLPHSYCKLVSAHSSFSGPNEYCRFCPPEPGSESVHRPRDESYQPPNPLAVLRFHGDHGATHHISPPPPQHSVFLSLSCSRGNGNAKELGPFRRASTYLLQLERIHGMALGPRLLALLSFTPPMLLKPKFRWYCPIHRYAGCLRAFIAFG